MLGINWYWRPWAEIVWQLSCCFGKALLSICTETEKTARRFAREKGQLEGCYFRFNVPNGLDNIAMEDSKSKNSIIAVTDRYLEDEETFRKVKACGKLLIAKESMSITQLPVDRVFS
jgi:hypothetical protein